MELRNQITVEQKTAISIQQMQSLEILSLNSLELDQYLKREFEENPFLEYDPVQKRTELTVSELAMISHGADQSISDIWEEEEEDRNQPDSIGYKDDLEPEELLLQIDAGQVTKEELLIMREMFDFLDEKGYLAVPLTEMADILGIEAALAEKCLRILQEMEPVGIFSENLSQCLSRQVQKLGITNRNIYRIIEEYLEELANGEYEKLAQFLGISEQEVRKCEAVIRKLNPFPLAQAKTEQTMFIIPDLVLTWSDGTWCVQLNESESDCYSISSYYAKMVSETKDSELRGYLLERWRRARWILDGIERRKRTLRAIAGSIAEKQEAFFLGKGRMRPMTRREIGLLTSLHESTVGRAVNDKYLQFPCGTMLMSELFCGNAAVGEHTAFEVKERIRDLIDGESKMRPYSDAELVECLRRQGITVSRRAAAKYREQMGIGSSFERKKGNK
ncbi:MAG: RNA polymerase factor sigma-54 [Lachnospiraceae bacterium]|nr:RNA polymerase factor sigma-54 [Lachnospiraceae bacterium]